MPKQTNPFKLKIARLMPGSELKKLKWVIKIFKPYKSPRSDQIFPGLLQNGIKILLPTQVLVFTASFVLRYLSKALTGIKVSI
jgi:hypothetical protein